MKSLHLSQFLFFFFPPPQKGLYAVNSPQSLLKAITPPVSASYACPCTSSFYGFFCKCNCICSCLNICGNLYFITKTIYSLFTLQDYPYSAFLSLASNLFLRTKNVVYHSGCWRTNRRITGQQVIFFQLTGKFIKIRS